MPEKFIPYHLTQPEENPQESVGELSAHEAFEKRKAELRKAPDLEKTLEKEVKDRGFEVPANRNLSLVFINEFRYLGKEVKSLRKTITESTDPQEKTKALQFINEKKKKIDEYLTYGPSFEKAYREYLSYKTKFFRFNDKLQEKTKLQKVLEEASFKAIPEDAKMDEKSYARLEMISRTTQVSTDTENAEDKDELAETLKYVYDENSEEYQKIMATMNAAEPIKLPPTKKEITQELQTLSQDINEEWEDPMVRYFYQEHELDKSLTAFVEGQDVIETPSTISNLNKLDEWERQHQRTTFGGALVGPPGTGKTTTVHHYLESKGRKYAYIDLSEDVTRYLLYGSKSLEFKNPVEYFRTLSDDITSLDENNFRQFISENSRSIGQTLGLSEDESQVVLLKQIEDELAKGSETPELAEKIKEAQEKFLDMSNKAYRRELAHKFSETVKKNGWRDGVVTAALRRGDSILFDEFNKNKNWSLIYGLMTAKPGEKWYFSDNDETIDIPEDWRMYFTANIGRKHGGFEVAEALASRAQGKVLEVEYPPKKEEMNFGLISLSNPDGIFLRPGEDLVKLYFTIGEFFPKIRKYIEDKKQAVPISYRTLRDLGEKLVLYKDKETGKPVYQPTNKSYDEALYEVLIETSPIHEDKTVPREIVALGTKLGLFLDDKIKDKVVSWIGEEEYEKNKNAFAGHEDDFQEIKKKILGISSDTSEIALPEMRNF